MSSITLNACLLRQAFFVPALARLASEIFFEKALFSCRKTPKIGIVKGQASLIVLYVKPYPNVQGL